MSANLIPTNGVHISKSHYPSGFYVALYDARGFTSGPRWFPSLDRAQEYAKQLAEQGAMKETLIARLRSYADNPAKNGMVPIHPDTLREFAAELEHSLALARAVAEHFADTDAPLGERARALLARAEGK